ncbi:MAG: hypothetical protein K0S33_2650 [Bacteroidetes bacterium]|jgi:hypothetical protein|nr:hypothetical protein [Bacteroidota bacterium]
MHKACIFIIACLFCAGLAAQNDFAAGYIIGPKNDTIRGEVKLFVKNEMDYYVKTMFRNKPAGGGKQYFPSKIHGYGVEDRHYASIKYYDLWVFMQVVCKGKIMFYEYKPPVALGNDKMQSQFFILKGGFEEMEQIFPDTKVKKQIRSFISDDKELVKEIENTELHYAELVQLIDRYNQRNK